MLFVVKRAATADPACGDLLILESNILWFLHSSKNCIYFVQAWHIDKPFNVCCGLNAPFPARETAPFDCISIAKLQAPKARTKSTGFVKSFPKKIGPLANNPLGFPHNQTNGQKQFPCCCCVLCSFDRLKLLRHLFKVQKSDSTLRKELKKHRSQKFSCHPTTQNQDCEREHERSSSWLNAQSGTRGRQRRGGVLIG